MLDQLHFRNDKLNLDDAVYHVQTETRLLGNNSIIQTLIFSGGRILDRRRTELVDRGAAAGDAEFIELLNQQHGSALRHLRHNHHRRYRRRRRLKARDEAGSIARGLLAEAAEELDSLQRITVVGRDGVTLTTYPEPAPSVQSDVRSMRFALLMGLIRNSLRHLGTEPLVENLVSYRGGRFLARRIEQTKLSVLFEVNDELLLGNLRLVARKTSAKLGAVYEELYPGDD